MIYVYHAIVKDGHLSKVLFGFRPTEQKMREEIAAGILTYECVANVRTFNIAEAFRLTNSIDNEWWKNAGVTMKGNAARRGGARSTSVGDVIVVGGQRAYLCTGVEFARLEKWVNNEFR